MKSWKVITKYIYTNAWRKSANNADLLLLIHSSHFDDDDDNKKIKNIITI